MCSHMFVGEFMLNLDVEFWVDFSVGSGRLYAFYTVPEKGLVSLSIRKDQVDSVCLNWVVNDGRSKALDTQEYVAGTQSSTSTFAKDEKVLFFHVVLTTEFENITHEHKGLNGKEHRSVYFVFRNGQLVEKMLQEMNYALHTCGTKDCQRPRALRRILANQNKLSYTQSWCPDSEVTGLDNSQSDRSISHLDQTRQTDADPDTTLARIRQSLRSPHQSLRSPHQSHRSVSPGTPFRLESISSQDTQTQDEEAGQSFCSSMNRTSGSCQSSATPAESRSETSTTFYPSMSAVSGEYAASVVNPESGDSDDDVGANATYNGSLLNTTGASTETFYEDPLPRKIREKFANQAPKRTPFRQFPKSPQAKGSDSQSKSKVEPEDKENSCRSPKSENVKNRRKYLRNAVRNSSPKPSASHIQSPPTPPISEICSPRHNVFNATMSTIADYEENCSPEPGREEFQNEETCVPSSPVTIWDEEEEKSYLPESDVEDQLDQDENNSNIENRGSSSESENGAENCHSAPNAISESKKSEDGLQLENLHKSDDKLQSRNSEPSVILASLSQTLMEVDVSSSHAENCSMSPIVGFSKTLLPYSMIREKSPSPMQDPDAKVVVFTMSPSKSTAPEKNLSPKFDVADETVDDSDWNKTIISESDSEQYSPPTSKSPAQSTKKTNTSGKSTPKVDLGTPSRAESSSPSVYSPSPVFTPSPVKAKPSPAPSACSSLSPIVGFSKVLMDGLRLSDKSSESSPENMRESIRKKVPGRVPVKELRFAEGSKTVRKCSPKVQTPPGSSAKLRQRNSESPNSKQREPAPTGKLPCYAYASALRESSLNEKRDTSGYDPYDLRQCSEMDEYKQQIFPELKTKTYPGRKKTPYEHKISAKKRKRMSSLSPSKRKSSHHLNLDPYVDVTEDDRKKKTVQMRKSPGTSGKSSELGFLPIKFKTVSKQRD